MVIIQYFFVNLHRDYYLCLHVGWGDGMRTIVFQLAFFVTL